MESTNHTHAIAPSAAAVNNPAYLIEVDGRAYQIIPVDATPPPVPIYPAVVPRAHSAYQDPNLLIALGIGLIVASAGFTWLLMKAFAPPITTPSTVVMSPPVPEKHPYTIRSCTPSGLLGLNQACTEERGMR